MLRVIEESSKKFGYNFRRAEFEQGRDPDTSDFELSHRKILKFMRASNIAVEQVKIQLRCRLSLVPIKIPVRGKACSHI